MAPPRYPSGHTTVLPIVRQVCRPALSSPICAICPALKLVPFRIAATDASFIGLLAPQVIEALVEICASLESSPLVLSRSERGDVTGAAFADAVNKLGLDGRTQALEPVVAVLLDRPEFAAAKVNGKDELVAAAGHDGRPAFLIMRRSGLIHAERGQERAAEGLFGLTTAAVHCTGYVRHQDGTLSIWVARRAAHLNWSV